MSGNRPTGDEVRVIQDNRVFVQHGGARPNNDTRYYGLDTNYGIIQGVTRPLNGAITPVYTGDPRVAGDYRVVARTKAPPALPAFTLHQLEKRGTLNRMFKQNCEFNAYVAGGRCEDLSDFLYGWTDKLEVYAGGLPQTVNAGNRGDWANDTPIINQIPAVARSIYEVGALGFGELGSADIAAEVVDITYGNVARCAGCGNENDGTQWMYWIQKRLGTNETNVIYSTDGGSTTNVIDITGVGAGVDATAIDVAGSFLIVLVSAENAYYWATINQVTGVPGAFTKVTSGFVASKLPNDLLVYSTREVFIAADGGYVYKLADVGSAVTVLTAGGADTNNLNRINGDSDTLVAAGAAGTVIKSVNRGLSWAAMTDPSADAIQGLDVRDDNRYWVATVAGDLFYTLNGGATWTEKALSNAPTDLRDVVFATDEVGWAVGATTTPTGLVYATFNGGRDWTTHAAAPRMIGIPTTGFQRGNRIAVPFAGNDTLAANNVLIAGLGAATDGIVLSGVATYF